VGADAAFICNDRLPLRRSPQGYLETVPDLFVEVRSKNDSSAKVTTKVEWYLEAGVRLVWVLDAVTRSVIAHRPGEEPRVFADAETLTADGVIPDFAVAVADLFVE
jgi:Uma2 family endonuclease